MFEEKKSLFWKFIDVDFSEKQTMQGQHLQAEFQDVMSAKHSGGLQQCLALAFCFWVFLHSKSRGHNIFVYLKGFVGVGGGGGHDTGPTLGTQFKKGDCHGECDRIKYLLLFSDRCPECDCLGKCDTVAEGDLRL